MIGYSTEGISLSQVWIPLLIVGAAVWLAIRFRTKAIVSGVMLAIAGGVLGVLFTLATIPMVLGTDDISFQEEADRVSQHGLKSIAIGVIAGLVLHFVMWGLARRKLARGR